MNPNRPTDPVSRESANVVADRLGQLKALFPDAVTEGKIDFDKLRAALGESVAVGSERFNFGWAGRSDALALLQTPSRATLVPCPGESVAFDTTKNLFVEGDNLEVLKLLYKAYANKVKLIYIDPPYNTGQDFIYPDNFADPLAAYLELTGQQDAAGNLLTSNPETSGRYHSAWLSMMFPRLFLARQLLRDDGVIFVSIDDHEVHHLRTLMNEVFGEENFIATVVWQHSVQGKGYYGKFSVHHNYLLCYRKTDSFDLGALERTEDDNKNYSNPDNDPKGDWRTGDVRNALYRPNLIFPIETPSGKTIDPPKNGWRWSRDTIKKKMQTGEIVFSTDETRIIRKIYLSQLEGRVPETIWFGKDSGTTRQAAQELKELFGGESPFDTPKPTRLIRRLLDLTTDPESEELVLDFFAGSATTAHAVLDQNHEDGGNRRFILVQLPESTGKKDFPTIADIGKERTRRVIARLKNETGDLLRTTPEDLGFKVFRLTASHFEPWKGSPERDAATYHQQMSLFIDPLRAGWTPDNVLWEVAVKEGYGLNSTLEPVTCAVNRVFRVVDPDRDPPQSFRACLDDTLNPDIAKALELGPDDLFVCRDRALDDTLAANLALQCRLKTI